MSVFENVKKNMSRIGWESVFTVWIFLSSLGGTVTQKNFPGHLLWFSEVIQASETREGTSALSCCFRKDTLIGSHWSAGTSKYSLFTELFLLRWWFMRSLELGCVMRFYGTMAKNYQKLWKRACKWQEGDDLFSGQVSKSHKTTDLEWACSKNVTFQLSFTSKIC